MSNNDVLRDIPVVIMAGGYGTRMMGYSKKLPKPLLDFEGLTLIENVLKVFEKNGASLIYILLYYKSNLIRSYLEFVNYPGTIVCIEEKTKSGTVGGLRLLSEKMKGTFIVCNCDNLGDFDYESLLLEHRRSNADITIPVIRRDYQIPFGVIRTNNGVLEKIEEKPVINIDISTGIHIMEPRVLDLLQGDGPCDMPDFLNTVKDSKKVICVEVEKTLWKDMSIVE